MSNASNFSNVLLNFIKDGEPVDAAVANRPLATLDQRTRYLLDLVKSLMIGQAIILPEQTVDADTVVGAPVYFNPDTQQFENAMAVSGYNSLTGRQYSLTAAISWGVVLHKYVATQADILVMGYAKLDISAALVAGETVTAGAYYLSTTNAGQLTSVPPPIAIPLLQNTGTGHVLVIPNWFDLFNGHTHLHFSLRPVPAGAHADPGVGNPHVITEADSSIEGWLPASNAIFNGLAPVGAVFGYNISANASLAASWPPLPPDSAVLYQDGLLLSSDETNSLVVFDEHGIWWMSDCYASVPFPPDINTTPETAADPYPVSESYGECPFPYAMRLELWFSKQEFSTDLNAVTSLTSDDPRLVFSAQQGPVVGHLDLSFMASQEDPGGYVAAKSLSAGGTVLNFGPVVTGFYAKSDNVTLNSEFEETLTIGGTPYTVYAGKVGIDVVTDDDREIFTELVRLDGVEEDYYLGVMYLDMPPTILSSVLVRLTVPLTSALTNPTLTLNLRIMGSVAGESATLSVSYAIITAANSPAALPGSFTGVTINTAVDYPSPYTYQDVQGTPFTVAAGDDVLVMIQRNAADGYTGDLGLLRISGILAAS